MLNIKFQLEWYQDLRDAGDWLGLKSNWVPKSDEDEDDDDDDF